MSPLLPSPLLLGPSSGQAAALCLAPCCWHRNLGGGHVPPQCVGSGGRNWGYQLLCFMFLIGQQRNSSKPGTVLPALGGHDMCVCCGGGGILLVLKPQDHSSGLGGGVIFTIYSATTGDVEVINARERVPLGFTKNLLAGCKDPFPTGSQWIGIPGELRGYEEAHRRYGRLPWKFLFDPTIELLQREIIIPPVLSTFLNHPMLQKKTKESSICQLFCKDGEFPKAGETFHWPALKKTLTEVSLKGAKEFYEGEIANLLEADIRRAGGNLTRRDLHGFKAEVTQPLNISLGSYTVYAPPPPAGGFVLLLILNILKGFDFTAQSVETPNRKIETYHRIVEAMKFGNGQKPKLDDPDFSGIQKLLSDAFAEETRRRITEKGDHVAKYYNIMPLGKESHGTTHVSVIAKDGSAVSATSTINYPFGSMVYSNSTGIILNNELADFCRKKINQPIPRASSFVGERPPSAMVPSILLSKDKKSMLVIGGSGGELIISATALAIINKLWFGYDLKKAIEEKIFHVNTTSIQFEKGFDENVKKGLLERGHRDQPNPLMLNVVQGVSREGRCISAYSDKRKMGKAAGY
uniref:Glutathione hydrolase 5 proenzyme n=1 Tax=Crocodylus porosus TaxID=8502 RepID=A0A7M4E138_CROPO